MTVQDGDPTTVVQPGEGTTPVPVSLSFINNEFVQPSTGEFMVCCPFTARLSLAPPPQRQHPLRTHQHRTVAPQDVECPGTGEVIGTVSVCGAADVDAAVEAAKAAHPGRTIPSALMFSTRTK